MCGRVVLLGLLASLTLGATPVPTPKSQCEELLNIVLPMATKLLAVHKEFYPFGASMKPSGEITQTMGYDGREHPPSQPLIDLLRDGFAADAKARAIIASAIVYDVRTIPPGSNEKVDAVAIELDHWDNYSVVVLFPYTLEADAVNLKEPFAHKGEFLIFGRAGNGS
jgi:hypothetical protein